MTGALTLGAAPAGLLLTPGASADREHPTLVTIDDGIDEIAVDRLTLGTTSIKRAVVKVTEAAHEMADRLGVGTDRLVLGGRSFGGRACSVAVAEGLPAAGLILLSYPLHPPGKPEKLRVDHFGAITVPTFFLSGQKDPFGTPDEFGEHTASVAAPVRTEWVPGGHAPKGQDDTIVTLVRSFLALD